MAFARFASYLVTASMLVLAVVGLLRWKRLSVPARLIVANVGFSTIAAAVMFVMVSRQQLTRVPQELVLLVDTTLLTVAFALWQSRRAGRNLLLLLAAGYLVLWTYVLLVERWASPISTVSVPVGNAIKTVAAALTVIDRVWVTPDAWTDKLWFWCGIGVMLIFGTEVVLFPAWQTMLGVREDLIVKTFTFHLVVSILGYLLIARALWRVGRSPAGRRLREDLRGAL
ncbi:MAG: hypothetical protein AB7R55_09065 [Gemmatimonadales bacterium]